MKNAFALCMFFIFMISVLPLNAQRGNVWFFGNSTGIDFSNLNSVSCGSISDTSRVDCLQAVKHGNGRDWWIITRESIHILVTSNNSWYLFLFSPSGISNNSFQKVETLNPANSGRLTYDTLPNRICFVNSFSLVELYDFNRCTGNISNPETLEPPQQNEPFPWYWSVEFLPNGQYLYAGGWQWNVSSYLWQYDTCATNVAASKTLIWQSSYPV